ncbi:MAG: PAS domain S-box protein, partial [Nitrospirota bacterium]|nr:PAS domain S-box protein [Nitrospirota bacterium]
MGVSLFNVFYREAKNIAIKKLNDEQVVHARQAALGIEDFFRTWTGILSASAKMDEIINADAGGKRYINLFYEAHREQIMSITRMDERGTIIHTFPISRAIGSNISEQKHVQEILKEHRPVISDVFKAVQGFDAVVLHVPVFKGTVFKGTIAIVVNFESLAKRYLEVIKIGEAGYAWVISRDGTQLYSTTTGFTGRSVFENYKAYPSVIAMVNNMLKGQEGVAEYTIDRIGDRTVGPIKKYAVYMPIQLGNTFWSIVVTSGEQDVLSGLISFRNRLILLVGVIFIFGIVFSLLGTKAWFIVKEEANRRQAEEAIKASEKQFRELIESSPVAIAVNDQQQNIIFLNKKYIEIFGYRLDDIPTVDAWWPLAYPDPAYRQKVQTEWHEAVEKAVREKAEIGPLEYRVAGRDGTVRDIQFGLAPVGDLNLVIFNDITERKRALEALQASEARMKLVMDGLGPQMFVGLMDTAGVVLMANQPAMEVAGLRPEDVYGKPCPETYWFAYSGAVRQRMSAAIQRAAQGETVRYDEQIRVAEDQLAWIDLSLQPVRGESGKIVFLIPSANVITERKKAEEELNKYREHLEELVKDRTAELKDSQTALISIVEDLDQRSEELRVANERLKEVDRLKSMFIA